MARLLQNSSTLMQAAIFIRTYILVQLKYPSKQENYIKSTKSKPSLTGTEYLCVWSADPCRSCYADLFNPFFFVPSFLCC